jgi:D-sedoheptulose 7-phosphate isomerase
MKTEAGKKIIQKLSTYESIHVNWLLNLHTQKAINFVKKLLSANRIFICGNGGSMTTAMHLALDWSKFGGKNAIALDSIGAITAYANDVVYDSIFVNQLEKFKFDYKSDIIVLISGSGNSPNIVAVANKYQYNVIGMSGNEGFLIKNVDCTLPVDSLNIRVIEDAHLAYGHAIAEVLNEFTNYCS